MPLRWRKLLSGHWLSVANLINTLWTLGREPWSSGYGRRLMFRRSWVRIPALYTGWTWVFFTLICCKKIYCLFEKTENKRKRGRSWPIFKKRQNGDAHRYRPPHPPLSPKFLPRRESVSTPFFAQIPSWIFIMSNRNFLSLCHGMPRLHLIIISPTYLPT